MTNSRLEDKLILNKIKKRFRKTKLSKINEIKNRDSESIKSFSYIISLDIFQIRMHYHLDKSKSKEDLSLDILTSEGRFIQGFNNSNSDYAPILREIYQDIKERKTYLNEENERRTKEKHYQDLKKLKRIL